MRLASRIGAAAVVVAVALTAMTLQARAEDRSQLVSCQALIERAAQAAKDNGASSRQDAPELVRCRQIVREWMLRDARMSVDERGQPLR
jgi:Flp pilus assembly protein TadB